MEPYKVLVSSSYHQDLLSIVHHISRNLDAPCTASQLLNDIEKAVYGLATMPERFPLVNDPSLSSKQYRKCIVRNYLIFYKVDHSQKVILIHRILHARQNWGKIL